MKLHIAVPAAVLLLVSVGCAHTPDVTVGYYLAKTQLYVKVIRTVGCDSKKNVLFADAITTTPIYSADEFVSFDTRPLKGFLTQSDLKFEFYEDGRLKAVNATTTGKGEEILKTAISLFTSLAAKRIHTEEATKEKDECTYIPNYATGGTVTMIFEGAIPLTAGRHKIPPDVRSTTYARELGTNLGKVCAVVGEAKLKAGSQEKDINVPVFPHANSGDVLLALRQPAPVGVEIRGLDNCSKKLWEGTYLSGQQGKPYKVPIPRAAIFGKNTFAATFHEAGGMTMVQYATEPGAGQVLNLINTAAGASKEIMDKQTAELAAEANLIAAQQRLIKCRAEKTC